MITFVKAECTIILVNRNSTFKVVMRESTGRDNEKAPVNEPHKFTQNMFSLMELVRDYQSLLKSWAILCCIKIFVIVVALNNFQCVNFNVRLHNKYEIIHVFLFRINLNVFNK